MPEASGAAPAKQQCLSLSPLRKEYEGSGKLCTNFCELPSSPYSEMLLVVKLWAKVVDQTRTIIFETIITHISGCCMPSSRFFGRCMSL